MSSVLQRRHASDTCRAVRYTACEKGEATDDDDDGDEVAVVGGCADGRAGAPGDAPADGAGSPRHCADCGPSAGPGAGPACRAAAAAGLTVAAAANGPAALSGLSTTNSPLSDRTMLIGKRLSGMAGRVNLSSPEFAGKVIEQKSASRHSSMLDMMTPRKGHASRRGSGVQTPTDTGSYVQRAASVHPLTSRETRRLRRKELHGLFGKMTRSGDRREADSGAGGRQRHCRLTFVFDPSGRLAYWWSFVVSMAFVYNFWVLIYRFAFEEISRHNVKVWFSLDYTADLLYVLDIAFRFRTGFLQEGVLQTDITKLRLHYMNSTIFYIDCLCLLPLDILYLSIGYQSMLRCFRLVKIYRLWAFLDRTERHTNYPNAVRTVTLLHYLFVIYHWNACLLRIVDQKRDSNDSWLQTPNDTNILSQYLHSLYWSTLTMTTIGQLPRPVSQGEYVFVIIQFVVSLLLFAAILGHVANIVTSISAGRKDFQARLDLVKTYMSIRRVPIQLQDRVIRWFDYLWLSKKSLDEEHTLSLLPDKLKAEIALHVHLDTLRQVEIFQNTEAGFLCELVLKLKPVLFSPGDYICRNGEVGKEMYIVSRGKLQVVMANGKTVLANLKAGSYFGEISILNMGNAGNRRTASVRSVGYSDLFCLSKRALWDVLKDYPTARVRLEAIAVKRLERYKKVPMEKVTLSRSKSTPGLVESMGRIPLETMRVDEAVSPSPIHRSKPSDSTLNSLVSERGPPPCTDSAGRSSVSSARGGRPAVAGDDLPESRTASSIASYDGTPRGPPGEPGGLYPAASPVSPRSFTSDGTLPLRPADTALGGRAYPVPAAMKSVDLAAMAMQPYTHVLSPPPPPPPPPLLGRGSAFTALQPPPAAFLHPPAGADLAHSRSMCHIDPQPPHAAARLPAIFVGSVGSLAAPDAPNELLLQEITRLRERLHSLETENTNMSLKLNQQQWEVDHRLAEIEMQICGSGDSNGSGSDDRSVVGNKESVI